MYYLKKIFSVMGNDLFTSFPVFTLFAQRIFRVAALGKFGHWRLRIQWPANSIRKDGRLWIV